MYKYLILLFSTCTYVSVRTCACMCVCACVALVPSNYVSGQLGLYWSIADFVLKQRLRWFGHLKVSSYPSKFYLGELMKKRPFHGTKKQWRDEVMRDLKAIGMEDLYAVCQGR